LNILNVYEQKSSIHVILKFEFMTGLIYALSQLSLYFVLF